MILPLAGLVLGAAFGAWRARARGGNRLDVLQWAAVAGMIGGVIGLFALVLISRSAG